MRVAVLEGGRSLERQVSLKSGARVAGSLARLGHAVAAIDVGPDLVERLQAAGPDAVFVALHGRDGEDGTVQELLELLGLRYTGSGPAACLRCMDKVLTKHALLEAGIATPDFLAFDRTAFQDLGVARALPAVERRLALPLVVKPARGGSSLGVRFVASAEELPAALVAAFSYDDKVLLERYVDGRDLSASLLDGEPLPIVEAIPRSGGAYDFEARYEIGRTEFVCPAELPEDVTADAQDLARRCYELLGCRGFARVDLLLSEGGEPTVLEVNAIPGLTDTSLFPQAAEAAGHAFDDVVQRLVELA